MILPDTIADAASSYYTLADIEGVVKNHRQIQSGSSNSSVFYMPSWLPEKVLLFVTTNCSTTIFNLKVLKFVLKFVSCKEITMDKSKHWTDAVWDEEYHCRWDINSLINKYLLNKLKRDGGQELNTNKYTMLVKSMDRANPLF